MQPKVFESSVLAATLLCVSYLPQFGEGCEHHRNETDEREVNSTDELGNGRVKRALFGFQFSPSNNTTNSTQSPLANNSVAGPLGNDAAGRPFLTSPRSIFGIPSDNNTKSTNNNSASIPHTHRNNNSDGVFGLPSDSDNITKSTDNSSTKTAQTRPSSNFGGGGPFGNGGPFVEAPPHAFGLPSENITKSTDNSTKTSQTQPSNNNGGGRPFDNGIGDRSYAFPPRPVFGLPSDSDNNTKSTNNSSTKTSQTRPSNNNGGGRPFDNDIGDRPFVFPPRHVFGLPSDNNTKSTNNNSASTSQRHNSGGRGPFGNGIGDRPFAIPPRSVFGLPSNNNTKLPNNNSSTTSQRRPNNTANNGGWGPFRKDNWSFVNSRRGDGFVQFGS